MTQVLITGVGAGMIVAGVFPPDPAYGYPEGAPPGMPADLSPSSVIHGLAFVVSVLCWCALLIALGVWLARARAGGWAAVALVVAVALLAVPVFSAQPFGTVLLYVVVTVAFLATSALLAKVSSQTRRSR